MGPTLGLKSCKKTLVALTVVVFIVMFAWAYNANLKNVFKNFENPFMDEIVPVEDPLSKFHENTLYQLLTYGCVIKRIDPWDSRTKKYFWKENQFRCPVDQREILIDQDENGHLKVNFKILEKIAGKNTTHFYCRKWTIFKNESDTNDKHAYRVTPTFIEFSNSTSMEEEFVEIKCFLSGTVIYRNYFFNVIRKPQVETECKRNSVNFRSAHPECKNQMSVLMIGIESISRTNFMRQMPQTFDFVANNLNAIDMLGYNRVASHGYPALIPSLTGCSSLQIAKKRGNNTVLFDMFKSAGYRTAFVENTDESGMSLPGAIHYRGSTLYSAVVKHALKSNCWRGKPDDARLLEWLSKFQKTFAYNLHFGYFWVNRFSRLGLNGVQHLDPHLSDTLRSLYKEEMFNNTLLVILSGYGVGYGRYREPEDGHQEENLPLMYLAFPLWFKEAFSEVYQNVQENRHRLVTLFDLYETLIDVQNCEYKVKANEKKEKNGISFFKQISDNRTCEDAGIPTIYCACTENVVNKNPKESEAKMIGEILVEVLNKHTKAKRNLCAEFRLQQVLMWRKVIGKRVDLQPIKIRSDVHYVKVSVSPGELEFEATFTHLLHTNNYVIDENIRRINYDSSTTHCIKNRSFLKSICYCRKH